MGLRDSSIEFRDFGFSTLRMLDQRAHLAELFLDVVERAGGIEFGDLQSLVLQEFAGRALGEAAGDNDIRPQRQHVLGLAGQQPERLRLVLVP